MLKKTIFAIIISITIIGCKSLRAQKQELTKKDLSGYWQQQGEGEIIEINDSLVISYHSSNFNCYPNWKISRKRTSKQAVMSASLDKMQLFSTANKGNLFSSVVVFATFLIRHSV